MKSNLIIYLSILIYSQYSISNPTKIATQNAINTSRRALLAVPEIRQIVQEAGEDALKVVGLTKRQAAYLAPALTIIQGRMTTKYIRGLRLRGKEWSIVPLIEYRIRNDELRAEVGFFYAF